MKHPAHAIVRASLLLVLTAAWGCGPRPAPAVRSQELDAGWRLRLHEGARARLAESASAATSADTAVAGDPVGDPSSIPATIPSSIPARVPGAVHTDLLGSGLIPDPLRGDVEAALQWIEAEDWTYVDTFAVDPALLTMEHVELVFGGLDTYARVRLNGQTVLTADNQFRTWRVDAGAILRPGTNTLEVDFSSPIREGALRAAAHPWPIPHQEPDVAGTRAFTRKAAYQYGWDWGPRYVTSGISGSVRLEGWSGVRVRDAAVTWHRVAGQGRDTVLALLRIEVESGGAGPVRIGVRSPVGAFDPAFVTVGNPSDGSSTVEHDMSPRGASVSHTHVAEVRLVIPDPELWWPAGSTQGTPHLYDVEIDAVAGRRWHRVHRKIGLRTIQLVTAPDSVGESFLFRVNGEPVFMRGANLVPPDHFPTRTDSAAYARLLQDAVDANMNMVRVWGGGVYPPDVFYDIADQLGLLVWQDFMFANVLVPGDSAFAASVRAEATDQVRRLRVHPSLALWCGNNEIAEGWANWGWRDDYAPEVAERVDAAYRRVFEDVLPDVLRREDPTRPYWPSSPSIGWGHTESLERGDSHYWGVWWGMEPFRAYAEKVPRFASEFGFQALPDPATVAAFSTSPPGGLDDSVMRAHQKHPTGYATIRTYLDGAWPIPPEDSLDAWSYVSQLAQARGVGLALEAHRRSWPHTGGTLYWQFNDTWPVVSWSSVDAFGRPKALYYAARRIFGPVSVLLDVWADTVGVWIAADRPVTGTVRLRTLDVTGRALTEDTFEVSGHGPVLKTAVASLIPAGVDRSRVVVAADFAETGAARVGSGSVGSPSGPAPFPRDVDFLVPPVDVDLPRPDVMIVGAEPTGDAWTVTFTAVRFAFGVRLSLDGGARFSDNYLHLLSGDTVTVRVVPDAPIADILPLLRVRTLADSRSR